MQAQSTKQRVLFVALMFMVVLSARLLGLESCGSLPAGHRGRHFRALYWFSNGRTIGCGDVEASRTDGHPVLQQGGRNSSNRP